MEKKNEREREREREREKRIGKERKRASVLLFLKKDSPAGSMIDDIELRLLYPSSSLPFVVALGDDRLPYETQQTLRRDG